MSIILIILILLLVLRVLRAQKRLRPLEVSSSAHVARPPWAIPCFLGLMALVPVAGFLAYQVHDNTVSGLLFNRGSQWKFPQKADLCHLEIHARRKAAQRNMQYSILHLQDTVTATEFVAIHYPATT